MNKELLLEIIKNNIDIGHYVVLDLISKEKNLEEIWKNTKFRSYREALIRKNIIYEIKGEYYLSDKGIDILNKCRGFQEPVFDLKKIDNQLEIKSEEILQEVKDLLERKTGKRRLDLPKIGAFLCSKRDFQKRLQEFCQKFNQSNLADIKQAILDYTQDLLDNKVPYPRKLINFIYKDDPNKGLISDMETYMESITEKKEINTEQLF